MRFQRKGMAAVMDAMLFIIIIGIAVSAVFVYTPDEPEVPMAERVHNDIFRTELKTNDVFDVADTRVMGMKEIIAAHLTSGEGDIETMLYDMIRSMVPISHEFMFKCEFNGNVLIIGDEFDNVTSRYSFEHTVNGMALSSSLCIY